MKEDKFYCPPCSLAIRKAAEAQQKALIDKEIAELWEKEKQSNVNASSEAHSRIIEQVKAKYAQHRSGRRGR